MEVLGRTTGEDFVVVAAFVAAGISCARLSLRGADVLRGSGLSCRAAVGALRGGDVWRGRVLATLEAAAEAGRRSWVLWPCCFVPPDEETPRRAAAGVDRLSPADWPLLGAPFAAGFGSTGSCMSELLRRSCKHSMTNLSSSCAAGSELWVDASIG